MHVNEMDENHPIRVPMYDPYDAYCMWKHYHFFFKYVVVLCIMLLYCTEPYNTVYGSVQDRTNDRPRRATADRP